MPATVVLWSAVTSPPPAAYVDTNYLLLLYQAAYPPPHPNPRAAPALALHAMVGAAGHQLWTTPLALQEGSWAIMRPVIAAAKTAVHVSGTLADFRRHHRPQYEAALATAGPLGCRFINFVLSRTGAAIRWPLTASGAPAPASRLLEMARFYLSRYQIEPADALHAACVRWDYCGGNRPCLISDDRQLQVIDGLEIYAYAHL